MYFRLKICENQLEINHCQGVSESSDSQLALRRSIIPCSPPYLTHQQCTGELFLTFPPYCEVVLLELSPNILPGIQEE